MANKLDPLKKTQQHLDIWEAFYVALLLTFPTLQYLHKLYVSE